VTGSVELKSITPINIGAIPAASGSYDAAGTAAAAVALHEATYAHADIATALQAGDDAASLGSGEATDGYVLTADGTGGAAWEAPSGGEGGTSLTRQHVFAAPYSYCGTAPVDSLTSAEVWTITRLTISAAGAVSATATATDVAWDDYATATYS
jgi:hypothetical protein